MPYAIINGEEIEKYATIKDYSFYSSSTMIKEMIKRCYTNKTNLMYVSSANFAIATIYIVEEDKVLGIGGVFLGSRTTDRIKRELIKDFIGAEGAMNYFKYLPIFTKDEFMRSLKFISKLINETSFFNNYEKFTYTASKIINDGSSMVNLDQTNRSEFSHNSYYYEKSLIECISLGKRNQLEKLLMSVDKGIIADLSGNKDELRSAKNAFICGCTIASRAAIEGNVNPEVAYSIADYYIQQVEGLSNLERVSELVHIMFFDFTERVSSVVKAVNYSKLINDTLTYVNEHLIEDINTIDLASSLYCNKEYLLKKFRQETGKSLVEYIQEVKIAEAKMMLKYSEFSILEISEYLSFNSQSYFTKIFGKWVSMTPQQYRDYIHEK